MSTTASPALTPVAAALYARMSETGAHTVAEMIDNDRLAAVCAAVHDRAARFQQWGVWNSVAREVRNSVTPAPTADLQDTLDTIRDIANGRGELQDMSGFSRRELAAFLWSTDDRMFSADRLEMAAAECVDNPGDALAIAAGYVAHAEVMMAAQDILSALHIAR